MAEFINTIDALGDDVVIDSIIDRTITELKDDGIETVGAYAFAYCTSLVTLDLPNVITVNNCAWHQCSSLSSVNLPNATTFIDPFGNNANCTSLKKLRLPKATYFSAYTGNGHHLTILDLPVIQNLPNYFLPYCQSKGCSLLLRNTSGVCSLGGTNGLHNVTIYVPASLIDSYKAATNWSTYADQFRALEDYTVDGTTTGELDETKI